MKHPVTHVLREPIPWRRERKKDQKTECGKAAAEFTRVVTAEEARREIKDLGIQRATMQYCMTCINCGGRWGSWGGQGKELFQQFDHDPVMRLQRECNRQSGRAQLNTELRALARLAELHGEEFRSLIVWQQLVDAKATVEG